MDLDLHGVRHVDVKNMVIHFVEDHWNSIDPHTIITGHSPQMKALVKEVLDEYKLNYSDKDFFGIDNAKIVFNFN